MVSDLSNVHYRFAKIIKKQKLKLILNCGYGTGYTVLEVVNKFNFFINKKINFKFKDQRKNEMGYSCADTKKLKKFYNFRKYKKKIVINDKFLISLV